MGMVVQIVQISMRHVQFHTLEDVTTTIHYFWYVHVYDTYVFLYLWPQKQYSKQLQHLKEFLMHPLSIQTPLIPGNHWYILDIYIFTFSNV